MYTEEEAKEKRCPNIKWTAKSYDYCIASDCMMWKWTKVLLERTKEEIDSLGKGEQFIRELIDGDKGYCGLTK